MLIFKLVCQSLVPAGTTIPGKKNYIFTPLTFFLLLTLQLGMDSLSCPLDQSVHCSREAVSFHCHPCPVSSNSPTNLRWRMGAPGKNAWEPQWFPKAQQPNLLFPSCWFTEPGNGCFWLSFPGFIVILVGGEKLMTSSLTRSYLIFIYSILYWNSIPLFSQTFYLANFIIHRK